MISNCESSFAIVLRYLMEKHQTTQKELGDFVGVRPQSISLWAQGQTQPTADKIIKIAHFFGVSTDDLLLGNNIESQTCAKTEAVGLNMDCSRLSYNLDIDNDPRFGVTFLIRTHDYEIVKAIDAFLHELIMNKYTHMSMFKIREMFEQTNDTE